jgi:hypothetical protein
MSKKILNIIFYFFAALGFIVMLYHLKGIFFPNSITPAWRHAIFVVINAIGIYGVLKRPSWFIYFALVLTVQQFYSHGSYAIHLWQTQNKLHWISIADLILLPILLLLLYIDKKK